MKYFSIWVIAATLTILSSPVCSAQTMYEMKDEASVKYKQADTDMNRIYKLANSTCDSSGRERLKKAQLAWIKYRNLCCEAEASIYKGGTMYGLVYTNCMTDLTRERLRRLKVYDLENSWK
jgi:uncharacterized protein YecT (DUF1311 family)